VQENVSWYASKTPKVPLAQGDFDCLTPFLSMVPLNASNTSSVVHTFSHNNRMLQISHRLKWTMLYPPQNCSFPWGSFYPHLHCNALTYSTNYPKWRGNSLGRFSTDYQTDRETDRKSGQTGKWPVTIDCLCHYLPERNGLVINWPEFC